MPYEVTILGDRETIASLNRIEKEISVGLEQVLSNTAYRVSQELKARAPKQTGALQRSIDYRHIGKDTVEVGPMGDAGSRSRPGPATYAKYVEGGSAAHFPNIEDIARRLNLNTGTKIGYLRAYAAAQAISRRSRIGTKFIETTKEKAEQMFYDVVNKLVSSTIKS